MVRRDRRERFISALPPVAAKQFRPAHQLHPVSWGHVASPGASVRRGAMSVPTKRGEAMSIHRVMALAVCATVAVGTARAADTPRVPDGVFRASALFGLPVRNAKNENL